MLLPAAAAWRHHTAKEGFEVLFTETLGDQGWRFRGSTSAVEEGEAYVVAYEIEVDARWRTRAARITGRSGSTSVVTDGEGRWHVDGERVRAVDGCLDLDLEASAFTNAFPVQRLRLAVGASAEAPAAYIRALDLGIQPLPQSYRRLDDGEQGERYDYVSPEHDSRCELEYDASGLVLEYPGIASRVPA